MLLRSRSWVLSKGIRYLFILKLWEKLLKNRPYIKNYHIGKHFPKVADTAFKIGTGNSHTIWESDPGDIGRHRSVTVVLLLSIVVQQQGSKGEFNGRARQGASQ